MNGCVLLFTGGNGPVAGFDRSLIPPCVYTCAADSGIDTAIAMGYEVDEAIGDFDSLSTLDLLQDIVHTRLPREKDITDTEALLQHIREKGFSDYVLIGGGEGRFDHLLHLYTLFTKYGPPRMWFTARERMVLVSEEESFSTMKDLPVSIIPALSVGKSIVSSQYLYWELKDFPISMLQQSISNKSREERFSISVSGDPVFVSIPFP